MQLSQNIIDLVIKGVDNTKAHRAFNAMCEYIESRYGGDFEKINLLNILAGNTIIEKNDISLPYIVEHKSELFYKPEDVVDDSISVLRVDNISCIAIVTYNDKEGKTYDCNLSWVSYPQIIDR